MRLGVTVFETRHPHPQPGHASGLFPRDRLSQPAIVEFVTNSREIGGKQRLALSLAPAAPAISWPMTFLSPGLPSRS